MRKAILGLFLGLLGRGVVIGENSVDDKNLSPTKCEEYESLKKELESSIENIDSINEINELVPQKMQSYNAGIKKLILGKIDGVKEKLGPSPCEYAVLALGSFAKGDMVPGSDFEFALLLNKPFREKSEIGNYFTNFTYEIKKAIEPDIPLDRAGTTPLGDKGKNRLIGDRQQLLKYQEYKFWKGRERTHQENPYLFTIMATPTLLSQSSSKMGLEYEKYIFEIKGKLDVTKLKTARSLKDTAEKHHFLHGRYSSESERKFMVKYDLHRALNQFFDHLDLHHQLEFESDEIRSVIARKQRLDDSIGCSEGIITAYNIAIYLRVMTGVLSPDVEGELDLGDPNLLNNTKISEEFLEELMERMSKHLSEVNKIVNKFFDDHDKSEDRSYLNSKVDKNKESHRKIWINKKKVSLEGNREKRITGYTDSLGALNDYSMIIVGKRYYDVYHLDAQLEGRLEDEKNIAERDYSKILDKLHRNNQTAKNEDDITYAKNQRKIGVSYQREHSVQKQQQAKLPYLNALESLCSMEPFRASKDTPKVLLVKVLTGLAKLDLEFEDIDKIKTSLDRLPKGHFRKVRDKFSDLTEREQLLDVSRAIASLIHDSRIKEELEEKYLKSDDKLDVKSLEMQSPKPWGVRVLQRQNRQIETVSAA